MALALTADVDTTHHTNLRAASAVALGTLAIFNLMDIITTRMLLARGAIESNPLAKLLLPGGGVEIAKAAFILALAFLIVRRRPSVPFTAGLWFGAGFYFLTVVSNLLILGRVG